MAASAVAQTIPGDRVIPTEAPVREITFSAAGLPMPVGSAEHRAFSRDRKLSALARRASGRGSEYLAGIWDDAGTERRSLAAGLGGVSAMAFSPDGLAFAAASYDTNVR